MQRTQTIWIHRMTARRHWGQVRISCGELTYKLTAGGDKATLTIRGYALRTLKLPVTYLLMTSSTNTDKYIFYKT